MGQGTGFLEKASAAKTDGRVLFMKISFAELRSGAVSTDPASRSTGAKGCPVRRIAARGKMPGPHPEILS
jgi:hypothetical protein